MLHSMLLGICGSAAALATLHLASAPAKSPASAAQFVEFPLAGIPLIEQGQLKGLSFARIALIGANPGAVDAEKVRTFASDAVYDAVLGQSGSVDLGSRAIDPTLLKVGVAARLKRTMAHFAVDRVLVLQSEFRSSERLRALAADAKGES